jgi:hypothetical protein
MKWQIMLKSKFLLIAEDFTCRCNTYRTIMFSTASINLTQLPVPTDIYASAAIAQDNLASPTSHDSWETQFYLSGDEFLIVSSPSGMLRDSFEQGMAIITMLPILFDSSGTLHPTGYILNN